MKISSQKYVLIFVAIFFAGLISYRIHYVHQIERNPIYTVGKVIDIKITKYTVHNIEYQYYYEKKTYTGIHKVDSDRAQTFLNKYFLVTIAKDDASKSKINLEKRITNEKQIIEEGFQINTDD